MGPGGAVRRKNPDKKNHARLSLERETDSRPWTWGVKEAGCECAGPRYWRRTLHSSLAVQTAICTS